MMELKSFNEAHRVLRNFITKTTPKKHEYPLERMRTLMDYLGNPQNSYKVIHVAGTSGKSSTCYYMASLLKNAGKKVGLTISPYVDEVNERIQVGLRPLPEKKFCQELSKFLDTVRNSGIRPTYLELLVAFAYWEFKRQRVEYAVVEVGMGGLWDATNVIQRSDKVCIITDIGLDHTEALGSTLQAITIQKAGIIHAHNTVFTHRQQENVIEVLNNVTKKQQAELYKVQPIKDNKLIIHLPLFQQRNWQLAHTVYEFLVSRDGLPLQDNKVLTASASIHIPARMETITYKGKTIIMDGAHNAQKLTALATSIHHAYPSRSVAVLVGFISTKQSQLSLNLKSLMPIADHFIATSFDIPDAPKSSIEAPRITELLETLDCHSYETASNSTQALQKLLQRPEQILLITGSFYLLNYTRPLIMNKK